MMKEPPRAAGAQQESQVPLSILEDSSSSSSTTPPSTTVDSTSCNNLSSSSSSLRKCNGGSNGGVALMIQGTGSDVGKSILVAGLLRIASKRRGLKKVAPFKAQNMSNNAHATFEGGEMGRAQALQARAAGVSPHVDMNPVLLKPQTDRTCQVIVHGRPILQEEVDAKKYMHQTRGGLLTPVLESFHRLMSQYDMVIVEGAGSPAEINLRDRDIANMGFARAAGVPVCLVGDIDRGGVIAAVVGTKAVLEKGDADMIVGCIINKFRGDVSLFEDGVREIEDRTGWPCWGVVPWIPAAAKLPAEDAVILTMDDPSSRQMLSSNDSTIRIAVPMLSRIANFDDADPLRLEPNVHFEWIPPGKPIPRNVDVILLFGTKSTLGDLDFVRQQGWDHDIIAHARAGGHVTGICGGYQMLGNRVVDDNGVEGDKGERGGLGLLNVETVLAPNKVVRPVTGRCALSNEPVHGYEIHVGRTTGADTERPMLQLLSQGPDGARSLSGKIEGTYLHGLFACDAFRSAWLGRIKAGICGNYNYDASVDAALDELAAALEEALDVDALFASARPAGWLADDGS